MDLVVRILDKVGDCYEMLGDPRITERWSASLAFKEEQVLIKGEGMEMSGFLEGVNDDGRLRLRSDQGDVLVVGGGDVQLRPFS